MQAREGEITLDPERAQCAVPDPVIQPHHKGFPPSAVGLTVSGLCGRLALGEGGFVTPVLLLGERCLRANVAKMSRFCDDMGVSLAPHAKTTMSPEIVSLQMESGAWAITVATLTQAVAVRRMGIGRILVANEIVDPLGISWFGAELDRDESFASYCYVDSTAGVATLEEALSARDQRRPMPVLIEYGFPNGRGGVRTADEAVRLANQVRACDHLRLAGVAGYEGLVDTGLRPGRLDEVLTYIRDLRDAADRVYHCREGMLGDFIVSAGGSCFAEIVADELGADWRAGRPIRVVLRSGCYVTHDSGGYQRHRELVAQRREPLAFTAALELWSRVISRPEANLAILDFGRRDVGTDAGLPIPQHVLRRGGKVVEPCPPAMVSAVNDQHAYLTVVPSSESGELLDLSVGDLVGFGISHPCTTLDKWRLIPIVDINRVLAGAARTWF